VGLKIAGGVATLDDVRGYLSLVRTALGPSACTPQRLRFGASSLLSALLDALDGRGGAAHAEPGY
jgi:deoxyribose-phosphate aldolase